MIAFTSILWSVSVQMEPLGDELTDMWSVLDFPVCAMLNGQSKSTMVSL